tara:strand:- start:2727 stop:3530 length:804 start_codon:yes stop_codon:yes gene_type:complete
MVSTFLILFIFINDGYASEKNEPKQQKRTSLELQLSETNFNAGRNNLQFRLVSSSGEEYDDDDLVLKHEKKIHLILFDVSLSEFRHLHPIYEKGLWQVDFNLARNGEYYVWAEGKIKGSNHSFSVSSKLNLQGGSVALPRNDHLNEKRSGENDKSVVMLSDDRLVANHDATLSFQFDRTDERKPSLSTYLGEYAHVLVSDLDGQIIHAHPMNHGAQFVIHTKFPKSGDYRIWIEFIDYGKLKIIPLNVRVYESKNNTDHSATNGHNH